MAQGSPPKTEWIACPHIRKLAEESGYDEPWGDAQGILLELAPNLNLSLCSHCRAVLMGNILEGLFRDAVKQPVQEAIRKAFPRA